MKLWRCASMMLRNLQRVVFQGPNGFLERVICLGDSRVVRFLALSFSAWTPTATRDVYSYGLQQGV